MGQIQSLEDLLAFLRRRMVPILAIAFVGMLVALAVAKSRPVIYEAAAVLQVEMPVVAEDGAAPGTAAALILQTIEQDLTTRDGMMAVIERHKLFADIEGISEDRQAFLLRQAVVFQPVAASSGPVFGQSQPISALIIRVQWDDASLAARIANDFAQGVLDHSSAGSLDRARKTADFYKEESQRIADDITRAEADLATFKNDNADYLPEFSSARREELVGVETDLRTVEREVAELEARVETLRAKNSQRATDKRDLEAAETDLSARTAVRDQIAARQGELLASLSRAPAVEQEILSLSRKIDQLQDQYDVALTQQTEAEKAWLLTQNQSVERFALLERALTPEDSISGGRRKLAIAGTLAALLAGVAAAFLWEELFPRVRTAAQMERMLGIRPIVSIPDLSASTAGLAARLRDGGAMALGGSMTGLFMLGAAVALALMLILIGSALFG